MKTIYLVLVSLVILFSPIFVTSNASAVGFWRAPFQNESLLDAFHAGQEVLLKNSGSMYEVQIIDPSHQEHNSDVLEVVGTGADFLVLRDLAGTKYLRIPIAAIRCVVTPASLE